MKTKIFSFESLLICAISLTCCGKSTVKFKNESNQLLDSVTIGLASQNRCFKTFYNVKNGDSILLDFDKLPFKSNKHDYKISVSSFPIRNSLKQDSFYNDLIGFPIGEFTITLNSELEHKLENKRSY